MHRQVKAIAEASAMDVDEEMAAKEIWFKPKDLEDWFKERRKKLRESVPSDSD
jgi:hypothetical protein